MGALPSAFAFPSAAFASTAAVAEADDDAASFALSLERIRSANCGNVRRDTSSSPIPPTIALACFSSWGGRKSDGSCNRVRISSVFCTSPREAARASSVFWRWRSAGGWGGGGGGGGRGAGEGAPAAASAFFSVGARDGGGGGGGAGAGGGFVFFALSPLSTSSSLLCIVIDRLRIPRLLRFLVRLACRAATTRSTTIRPPPPPAATTIIIMPLEAAPAGADGVGDGGGGDGRSRGGAFGFAATWIVPTAAIVMLVAPCVIRADCMALGACCANVAAPPTIELASCVLVVEGRTRVIVACTLAETRVSSKWHVGGMQLRAASKAAVRVRIAASSKSEMEPESVRPSVTVVALAMLMGGE